MRVRHRVRIRFCKRGDLRLIGHRDLMRCFERLFRRARLPLAMSRGFHPKPRMTFPLALAVGIDGHDEVMELELAEARAPEAILERLTACAPPGLTVNSVKIVPEGGRKARVKSVCYRVPIPPPRRRGLHERIERLLALPHCPVRRPDRPAPVDLRPLLQELTLQEGVLQMRLRTDAARGVSPRDVLAALDLPELEREGVHLTRTAVEIQS